MRQKGFNKAILWFATNNVWYSLMLRMQLLCSIFWGPLKLHYLKSLINNSDRVSRSFEGRERNKTIFWIITNNDWYSLVLLIQLSRSIFWRPLTLHHLKSLINYKWQSFELIWGIGAQQKLFCGLLLIIFSSTCKYHTLYFEDRWRYTI